MNETFCEICSESDSSKKKVKLECNHAFCIECMQNYIKEKKMVLTHKVETRKIESRKVESQKVESQKVESQKVESRKVESQKVESQKVESPKVSSGG